MRGMDLYVRVNCVSVKVFVWKVGVKMSVSVCDLTVCTEVSIQHSQAPCCSSRYSKPGFCHNNGGGWQNPQQGICLWRLRRSGGVGLTRDTWGWNHVANHIFWRCCLQTLVCQGAVIMKLANPISIGRIQFCKKKTKKNKTKILSVSHRNKKALQEDSALLRWPRQRYAKLCFTIFPFFAWNLNNLISRLILRKNRREIRS